MCSICLDVKVTKSYSFPPKSLQIGFVVEIENKKSSPVSHHLEVGLEGYQDPSQKTGCFRRASYKTKCCGIAPAKRYSLNLEALQNNKTDADDMRGSLRWLGIAQQYFIYGLAMEFGSQVGGNRRVPKPRPNGAISASVVFSDQLLPAGTKARISVHAVCRPETAFEALDGVMVNNQTVGMSTAIEYTWGLGVIARPMLWVLRRFFHMSGRAIAIVLLTLAVKLLMLWPSLKAMKSAKRCKS